MILKHLKLTLGIIALLVILSLVFLNTDKSVSGAYVARADSDSMTGLFLIVITAVIAGIVAYPFFWFWESKDKKKKSSKSKKKKVRN
ncbi:hypothetical protein GF323_03280 [Candidatus Woesearchaeota archaeon]|nr:hypothetical protein [Candidatus Woesearchaeota archaeon]